MNNPENAIEVRNVKKFFKVYYDRGITWKDKILSRGRSRYEKREVLKGISFDVKKGEAIGLIGKNGCGKSTTLKLLTKIIYPNEGEIELQGRVSSLLELGAGFHPDMSGKENIYLNAAVFGLNRKEIDKRVSDIIMFSELEDFIDNPVRTYSSGMYMRLAFSVAINVDADVLLIDEILAVGDISFQKKCFEKLKDIKRAGTTIVIVSHSLDQIEKICDRTIWIENGCIKRAGVPQEIHEKYLCEMEQERLGKIEKDDSGKSENNEEMQQHSIVKIESQEKTEGNSPIVLEANQESTLKGVGVFKTNYEEQLELLGIDAERHLKFLAELSRYKEELLNISEITDKKEYCYHNSAIGGIDAIMYYYMIRYFRPKTLIEVGAGYSTLIAAKACRANGNVHFSTIEPYPMEFVQSGVEGLDELIEEKLQNIPLCFFEKLEENDILFIDSSHVCKAGSDVTYIFTNILPRLNKGVLIHFHDIFIPHELQEEWTQEELWNEQYVLHSLLINAKNEYETIMPNYYLGKNFRKDILKFFPVMPVSPVCDDVSYWVRKKANCCGGMHREQG